MCSYVSIYFYIFAYVSICSHMILYISIYLHSFDIFYMPLSFYIYLDIIRYSPTFPYNILYIYIYMYKYLFIFIYICFRVLFEKITNPTVFLNMFIYTEYDTDSHWITQNINIWPSTHPTHINIFSFFTISIFHTKNLFFRKWTFKKSAFHANVYGRMILLRATKPN